MKFTVLVYSRPDYSRCWASGIMSVAQTQPVRPVTHTFSYYAQYSAHESSLVPWTEHNILTTFNDYLLYKRTVRQD